MNPRYFVKYKNLRSPQPDALEVCIGRFYDEEAAMRRAKEAYDVEGYGELVSVRPETGGEARLYRVSRFFIRAVRIAVAVAIALFAYAWLSGGSSGIGDVRFSELTLNMVLSSLFKTGLALGAACLCWFLAFGDGPDS